jgi:hypothetical protein
MDIRARGGPDCSHQHLYFLARGPIRKTEIEVLQCVSSTTMSDKRDHNAQVSLQVCFEFRANDLQEKTMPKVGAEQYRMTVARCNNVVVIRGIVDQWGRRKRTATALTLFHQKLT